MVVFFQSIYGNWKQLLEIDEVLIPLRTRFMRSIFFEKNNYQENLVIIVNEKLFV